MTKLKISPVEEGYGVSFGREIMPIPTRGGRSRFRRELLSAASRVSVQWITDGAGYEYLQAFFRSVARGGAIAFTADLILDRAGLYEASANLIPGSLQLSSIRGEAHTLIAELEAAPIPDDPDFDETVIMLYEEYGDDAPGIILSLAHLVNVALPEAIE